MGCLSRCFCDPFKLTYVAAIVTSIEAVLFIPLNIVLICMYKCIIEPAESVALGFDKFWAFYFFADNQTCVDRGHYSLPSWIWSEEVEFPFEEERSHTTPHDNFIYQSTYLGLHTAWILTALVLLYGNSRKKWGYYIPWILVSVAIMVLDVTVSAFCITDLVTADTDTYRSAMFWILVLYFRLFLIFFINMSQFASVFNAFCKARHKRTKQERQRQQMAKAHQQELAMAQAAAEARVRAEMAEEYQLRQLQYQHQQQQGGAAAGAGGVDLRRKIPPPVPKKPAAPHELRPFSYLNPAYRPNDPTDVEGMRAHSAVPEDLAMGPKNMPNLLQGPYFNSDRRDNLQRHGSLKARSTQPPPSALKRYSSTRVQPSYGRRPMEPSPDYDFTMKNPLPRATSRAQEPRDAPRPYNQPQQPLNHTQQGPSAPYHNKGQDLNRTIYEV